MAVAAALVSHNHFRQKVEIGVLSKKMKAELLHPDYRDEKESHTGLEFGEVFG